MPPDLVAALFPELSGPASKEQQQRSAELEELVKDLLRHVHVHNNSEAMSLPDAGGVFPPAWLWKVSGVVAQL